MAVLNLKDAVHICREKIEEYWRVNDSTVAAAYDIWNQQWQELKDKHRLDTREDFLWVLCAALLEEKHELMREKTAAQESVVRMVGRSLRRGNEPCNE